MTPKHLEILTKVLAALRPLHTRVDSVGNELQRSYDDQAGEWRWSTEGNAAGEEITIIEEIGRGLEGVMEELRQFVFLHSDNPNFATIISGSDAVHVPLPRVLPSREEIILQPRRPGAPPYPFLKPPENTDD